MIPIEDVLNPNLPRALVIVPDALAVALDKATDEAIAATGDPAAVEDRAYIRNMLLAYYAEYGEIPEIMLEKRT